ASPDGRSGLRCPWLVGKIGALNAVGDFGQNRFFRIGCFFRPMYGEGRVGTHFALLEADRISVGKNVNDTGAIRIEGAPNNVRKSSEAAADAGDAAEIVGLWRVPAQSRERNASSRRRTDCRRTSGYPTSRGVACTAWRSAH